MCKGTLLQIQPKPRSVAAISGKGTNGVEADGNGEGKGAVGAGNGNRYQAFVKRWYADVKKEYPAWGMREVMVELAQRYRVEKEAAAAAVAGGVNLDGARVGPKGPGGKEGRTQARDDKMVEEVVLLESGSEGEQDGDVDVDAGPPTLDGVARRLDFFSLREAK